MPRPRNSQPAYRLRRATSGRFALSWTDPESGVTRRLSTGQADRNAAEQWRDRFVAGLASAPPPGQPTLADILSGYVAARSAKLADPVRLAGCAARVEAGMGRLLPSDLSQTTIDAYAAARTAEGRAAGTVLRELACLRAALRWAAANRWTGPPLPFRMPVAVPPPRERWLTRPEVLAWIDGAHAPHIALFIEIAIATAARRRAIQQLTWDQVDLAGRLIDFGAGRGNKRRSVAPVNDRLLAALARHAAVRTGSYVLEYQGRPAGDVKKALARAAERAGLEGVSAHTLRHTACTWMVMAGIPLREIARLAGMTEAVAERIYGKHAPGYLANAAAALNF